MAGKRLIDAAKLFNAGTSVAKQHFQLRRQKWDVYSKTSTFAKGVKNQTDRVTVTAAAAVELAKRFNEEPPEWQRARAYQEAEQASREDRKAQGSQADLSNAGVSVHETRTQEAQNERPIVQEAMLGALDQDDATLSSLRKRELQRQAERQIPEKSADSQPENRQGQYTFNERAESSSPDLSSLPRSKLPCHAEDAPEPQPASRDVDQDVYPQPTHQPAIETPSGINTDVYSSPKVARMLGQTTGDFKDPYAGRQKLPPKPLPEMVAAQERWQKQQQASASQPHASNGDAETQDLAASVAQEAETQSQPADPALNEKPAEAQYEMRESRVPSSRFGRIWQYGSLATGMAFGAVGESFRRITGGQSNGSLMLSEGNMSRLVAKLSRMRGAALKLGQMMSFQDSKILPPAINQVLQRVQDSADYMPPSQRDQILIQNLGQDWRDLFSHFQERPFAAASIGQVHKATLKSNGKPVAVKVQYPGVRNSIDSDLNNLSLLLTASRLLPKGLFLDRTIANARTELGWECDYERELQACSRFRALLKDESDVFVVPEVYPEASGPGVLTAEFMTGKAVTKIKDLTQQDRDWMGTHILRLCLRELMEWRFMQTDPNWTNFLYNRESQKLELLDFGASRDFLDEFVVPYVSLLIAASKGDRAACRDLSIDLGYLTGHESAAMTKAHVDSILTLAEPFVESAPEVYDFEDQTITDRVRANIGLMLRERLAAPPEETYSLHRKLSGAFLLCARLRSKVPARSMFANAVRVWEGREGRVEKP
ncbi:ABC1-domain-containing protein [Teratosphaeria nubilosa]|uniref:ABC1-domain-containing protein n=1 Tax=Teratosphaeria nubilosa TaxID=161662 RepID=A0A6G1KWC8_9PEZI|nr:ABC1-domain-containing protein [Teratosphaeria nubilosa]